MKKGTAVIEIDKSEQKAMELNGWKVIKETKKGEK